MLDLKEYSNLLGKIKNIFSQHSKIDISLNQLKLSTAFEILLISQFAEMGLKREFSNS